MEENLIFFNKSNLYKFSIFSSLNSIVFDVSKLRKFNG